MTGASHILDRPRKDPQPVNLDGLDERIERVKWTLGYTRQALYAAEDLRPLLAKVWNKVPAQRALETLTASLAERERHVLEMIIDLETKRLT